MEQSEKPLGETGRIPGETVQRPGETGQTQGKSSDPQPVTKRLVRRKKKKPSVAVEQPVIDKISASSDQVPDQGKNAKMEAKTLGGDKMEAKTFGGDAQSAAFEKLMAQFAPITGNLSKTVMRMSKEMQVLFAVVLRTAAYCELCAN
jgi:hypothetical protein